MNKLIMSFVGASALLFTGIANAALVNSLSNPTVVAMAVTNQFTSGPIIQAPGVTWSSTQRSVFGYNNGYGFSSNGVWEGLTMVGLDDGFGAMTYTFDSLLYGVGGFINYAPDSGDAPVISIYDANDNLIESSVLNFSTGGGVNSGFFYGFELGTASIASFTLSGAYIGLANLTIQTDNTPATVPLPAAAWLFGSALIPLVGVSRRKLGKTV